MLRVDLTLARLARFVLKHPKRILVIAGVAFCVGVPVGGTAFSALDPYEFSDPGTEAAEAVKRVENASGVRADVPLIVIVEGDPARTETKRRIAAAEAELKEIDGVMGVISPALREGHAQVSKEKDRSYLLPRVSTERVDKDLRDEMESRFADHEGVILGGSSFADTQVSDQTETDLQRAELMAFPLLFLLSMLFFRSLVAAALPLLLGGLTLVGCLVVLRLLHEPIGIGVLSINVATALGFGLAIDYSLFVVSRFREELARGRGTEAALTRSLETSGRTVLYSSLTVGAAFAALLVFPQNFLYSMGFAGIAVSLLSAAGALLVLPALLAVVGENVNALAPKRLQRSRQAVDLPDRAGPWYRLSHWVMHRPVRVAVVSAIVLILAGLPLTQVEFGADDASVLSDHQSSGHVDRLVREDFPPSQLDTVLVQFDTEPSGRLKAYAKRIGELPGVAAVSGPTAAGPNVTTVTALSSVGRYGDEAEDLARAVRAEPAPAPARVGGVAASDLDEVESVKGHLPIAAAILATTTLILLLLMTGSLVLPFKALVMNLLTLSAALGVVVLVFQEGALHELFDFRPQGIQIGILCLIFVAGFGLSTDYGVFTFSRMREARLSGAGNEEAVALGLERTGRIVTSAALLFAVAMGALVSGDIIGVKETGLGVAVAVLVDASVVRMFLVPALMAMLGERNWWAPRMLAPLARWAG